MMYVLLSVQFCAQKFFSSQIFQIFVEACFSKYPKAYGIRAGGRSDNQGGYTVKVAFSRKEFNFWPEKSHPPIWQRKFSPRI